MNMKLILTWGIVVAVLGLLIVACTKYPVLGIALGATLIAIAIAWAFVTIVEN